MDKHVIHIEYYMVNVISAVSQPEGLGISPSPEGEGGYQTEGWDKGMRSHLPCNVVCIIYLKHRYGEKKLKWQINSSNISVLWRKLKDPPPPPPFPHYFCLRVISRIICMRWYDAKLSLYDSDAVDLSILRSLIIKYYIRSYTDFTSFTSVVQKTTISNFLSRTDCRSASRRNDVKTMNAWRFGAFFFFFEK